MEVAPAAQSGSLWGKLEHWLSFHWARGGWIGVDLFFVLSGFLVSGLLFNEASRYQAISIKNFLLRRGLKIYPAFWVLIGFTACSQLMSVGSLDVRFAAELLFVQNYFRGYWNHTWSLAIEEHFYLLLLLLVYVLIRKGGVKRLNQIPFYFALIAVGCLSLRCLKLLSGVEFDNFAYLFPTHLRIDSLFFGVLLSYFYHKNRVAFLEKARQHRWPCILAGTLLLLPPFLVGLPYTPWLYTVGFSLLYVGAGLILIGFLGLEIPDFGWSRGLAYIGSHSYSIYLWHMVIREWVVPRLTTQYTVTTSIYLVGSILVGILASALVEFPVLRLRDRWFPSRTSPAP